MTRGQHRRQDQSLRERLSRLFAGAGTHRHQVGDRPAVHKATDSSADGRHRVRGSAA